MSNQKYQSFPQIQDCTPKIQNLNYMEEFKDTLTKLILWLWNLKEKMITLLQKSDKDDSYIKALVNKVSSLSVRFQYLNLEWWF